ncbi:DUF4056 domain-containing protein [Jiulongibacter sediminis]|uniref:DUF4056 domain-containing protein n=1 Tax=Jiulongibacter sediminis TaxID=1605367 RepID=UPI0026F22D76|nr:DUF4056 domain-containing protein [Jiulongibacter sediminis]
MKRVLFIYILLPFWGFATELPVTLESKTPPRIIRTCCAFGSDLKMTGVPFKKYSDISSVDQLGSHTYLGSPLEKNGIIYSLKGGFLDIGHLRDQADWTAYLFSQIQQNPGKSFQIELGYEGGSKILSLSIPESFDKEEQARLAAKIAFDLSVWHEIATFYGASTVPLVPERYSAFSMEDAYSNMLGALLGMEAILSEEPFEKAMTRLLSEKLEELEAVKTLEQTKAAMAAVKDDWWTDEYRLPSKNVLMKREFDIHDCLQPWLVQSYGIEQGESLCIATEDNSGMPLDEYYELSIKLNYKFPIRKLFVKPTSRIINQRDFKLLIQNAEQKSLKKAIKTT